MPRWDLTQQIWEGQDAFIIGGGPSLLNFDWEYLRGKNAIGCNSAFLLGEDICPVCLFGDFDFPQQMNPDAGHPYEDDLKEYKGQLFTCHPALFGFEDLPDLWQVQRRKRGLHKDGVGWNTNTGAAAVNLALLFGAVRVFLLGIDLAADAEGNHHWHSRTTDTGNTVEIHEKHRKNFGYLVADLPIVFPDRQVINVDGYSGVEGLETIALQDIE